MQVIKRALIDVAYVYYSFNLELHTGQKSPSKEQFIKELKNKS